ncbi:unnamed protein product [Albugo candida]|uniref:Uncharacterized protein n=1 Tax=Albugo candida TaxID=65357 RepID=A0A024G514_9STRA|nr:unnamed protein product [Albugo candida]|eukprot:CCI41772.1 unnamed protein product [Albugo candida]
MSAIEDLTQKIENTYSEIARIRSDVTASLTSFYTNSSSISIEQAIKLASKYHEITQSNPDTGSHSALSQLSVQLHKVMKQLQVDYPDKSTEKKLCAPSLHAQCVFSYTESQRIRSQIEKSEKMLLLIEKIILIDSHLHQIDALLAEGELVKASNLSKNAEAMLTMLRDLENNEENVDKASTLNILTVMEIQWLKKKSRVETHIYRFFAELVHWEDNAVRISSTVTKPEDNVTVKSLQENKVSCTELWSAAEVMGIEIELLESCAEHIVENIISPFLQSSKTKKLRIKSDQDCSIVRLHEAKNTTLETESSVAKSSEQSFFHRKILQIAEVLKEFSHRLFTEKAMLRSKWMALLWKGQGNLEKKLLDYFVNQLPEDNSVLATIASQFRESVSEFVDILSTGDLQPSIPDHLLKFAEHIHNFHAKRRVHSILSLGRDYIRRNYCDSIKVTGASERCSLFNTDYVGSCGKGKDLDRGNPSSVSGISIQESGDDFAPMYFQMPDYRISTCVHDMVELAHQTLMEASKIDERSAEILLGAVRDLFFLFQMMVPALYADSIINDGRVCMLYHNDCMYITYHMLSIGFHYAKRFPRSIQAKVAMIDLVPIFRQSAEKSLSKFTLSVQREFLTKVQALPWPSAVSPLVQYEDFVKMVNFKISKISLPWKEGLPCGLYQRTLGLMVEPMLAAFLDRIVNEEVISVSRSPQLHHIISQLLECVNAYDSTAQAEKFLPTIVQLQDVALILEPIASIQDMVKDGKISTLNKKRITILVRALVPCGSSQNDLLNQLEDSTAYGTVTE